MRRFVDTVVAAVGATEMSVLVKGQFPLRRAHQPRRIPVMLSFEIADLSPQIP